MYREECEKAEKDTERKRRAGKEVGRVKHEKYGRGLKEARGGGGGRGENMQG